MNNLIYTVTKNKVDGIDGNATYDWGNSAICAVVSILMVFVILIIIIAITHLIFKGLGYIDLKKEIDNKNSKNTANNEENTSKPVSFEEMDDDMVAAVLVATIDYQNEIKQDVKLVSIKEIK